MGTSSTPQITQLLLRWSSGDPGAREELIPLVYKELRQLARRCLLGQRPDHSLQSTALVHEAYLRMVECGSVHWDNRAQFFGLAAQLMRQVLVDYARKRNAGKRGAGNRDLTLDDACALVKGQPVDLLRLNDALKELARLDPKQSRIVELRFFGGLSIEETAHVLGMSTATVKRHWASARVWLHHEMS